MRGMWCRAWLQEQELLQQQQQPLLPRLCLPSLATQSMLTWTAWSEAAAPCADQGSKRGWGFKVQVRGWSKRNKTDFKRTRERRCQRASLQRQCSPPMKICSPWPCAANVSTSPCRVLVDLAFRHSGGLAFLSSLRVGLGNGFGAPRCVGSSLRTIFLPVLPGGSSRIV